MFDLYHLGPLALVLMRGKGAARWMLLAHLARTVQRTVFPCGQYRLDPLLVA